MGEIAPGPLVVLHPYLLSRHSLVVFAALALAGCQSPAELRSEADREVYDIIQSRRAQLEGFDPFTIDPATGTLRERLIAGEQVEPVDLQETLVIAAENSRDYRDRRESLFLTALDLTLQQWVFSVQETGGLTVGADGTLESPVGADRQSAGAGLSFSKLFGSGLAIVGSAALDTVRLLGSDTGSSAWEEITRASLTITQPLLRGFGEEIVLEPLTQAERDVVYEARSFERFRRTFAFDVTSDFFGILRQEDTLQNQEQNFVGVQRLRERNESFAEAGRLTQVDVDQAKQQELDARNSVIIALANLNTGSDDFKLFLGLPIDADFPLNAGDYLLPETWSFLTLDPAEELVVEIALATRLDYMTARDRVTDAQRRVKIAEDALRFGLDFVFGVDTASPSGSATTLKSERTDWRVDLAFDLNLDRLPERNAYRASIIALERTQRTAEELSDRIVADLRQQLRALSTARESYGIQQNAVTLAARRVESTELNLEAGRTDTRDVLESQEALVNARNALTAALTTYILSGLALYRDMELLRVTPDGLTVETGPILAAQSPGTPVP
jgi:outer membrane protein TolC